MISSASSFFSLPSISHIIISIISSNLFKDKLTYNSKVEYSAYLGFITCLSALIYALVNPFFEFSPIFQKITVILFMIWLPLTHYNLKIQND